MKKTEKKLNNISKIVVSSGLGKMRAANAQFEENILPDIIAEFASIVGQKPAVRKAKKSVAGFKVRQNDIVGITATLRGKRKNDFFIKLTEAVLPRVKDFRGISKKKVDESGNLSIGFKDQFIFTETSLELSKVNFGVEVTIVTENMNREKAIDFFKENGLPLTD